MDKDSKVCLVLSIIFVTCTIISLLLSGLEFVGLPILISLSGFFFIAFMMNFVNLEHESAEQIEIEVVDDES